MVYSRVATNHILASRFNGWKIIDQIWFESPIGTVHIIFLFLQGGTSKVGGGTSEVPLPTSK